MSGWYAMKRGAHDHPLFQYKPERFFVWSWLVANACWRPKPHDVGGKIITVQRGQLCVTQRYIAEQTGVGRQVIRKLISDLVANQAIDTKPANGTTQGKTLITICNYDKYQAGNNGGNPADNPRATQEQPIKEQDNNLTIIPVGEADASAPIEVSVVTTALWQAGKQILASKGVPNPGSMIGRWLKSHPPVQILHAIEAAQKSGTEDPIPYITEALKGGQYAKPTKPDPTLDAIALAARMRRSPGAHSG